MLPRQRKNWLRLGWTLGFIMLGVWTLSFLGVVFWQTRDTARQASAIVVLGAAQYVGHPSPVLRARIDHAIALWRQGLAPRIIFTGGFGDRDTTSEAAVGQRYAIAHGVPPQAILIENRGRSTSESLQQVMVLLDAAPPQAYVGFPGPGPRVVILVSDPFHMLRLSILARRYGMTPYTSPTRTSPISLNRRESWKYIFAESVKVPIAFLLERPD